MPITIKPSILPEHELDLTQALTAAVAHELWKQCGGNEVVNWLEAERIVGCLTLRARARGSIGGRHERSAPWRRVSGRQDAERVTEPIPNL